MLHLYVEAVVNITSRRGLIIDVHCINQLDKSKLVLCKTLIHFCFSLPFKKTKVHEGFSYEIFVYQKMLVLINFSSMKIWRYTIGAYMLMDYRAMVNAQLFGEVTNKFGCILSL